MKYKSAIFGLVSLLFLACAEKKTREIDGEFLYIADAAVIKGNDFIYGVKVDAKMMELAERVKKYKRDDFDMVPVKLEGVLTEKEKGAEGWDTILAIKRIISVSPPKETKESEPIKKTE